MSCWWLFCIIVVAIYCGNLIAFLTVTKDKPPFNSLDELMKQKGEFSWGTLGGSAWEDLLITVGRCVHFVTVNNSRFCVVVQQKK